MRARNRTPGAVRIDGNNIDGGDQLASIVIRWNISRRRTPRQGPWRPAPNSRPRPCYWLRGIGRIHQWQQRLSPVHPIGDQVLHGADRVVGIPRPQWSTAVLNCPDSVKEHPAGCHDSHIGRTQKFPTSVYDGPHTLLDGAVLGVDSGDAGERLGPLGFAIYAPVVGRHELMLTQP